MKLAIMQPYFFPYIGYFQLIHAVDKMILYDQVNYIKKGWINRNRILELNNGPVFIHVPVMGASSFKKICDIKIDLSTSWSRKISEIIYHNYKRSSFFNDLYPFVNSLLTTKYHSLTEFNYNSIQSICNLLNIRTPIKNKIELSSSLEAELKVTNSDIKKKYWDNFQIIDVKYIRIFEIFSVENADNYVNPIGGMGIYDKQIFERNNIQLNFLATLPYTYNQNQNKFHPHLSIIDVLMHNGVEGTRKLLDQYELV